MELKKYEIRVLIKHYWKQDYIAVAAARRLCEEEGEGVVSKRVAQRWFQRFNTGEKNTKDLPRSGRPKLWDIENIRWVLEENPQKSTRRHQKNLVHQKIPHMARLRHLKNHTEAVDLYLMNWHLERLDVERISVVSLSAIPWMLGLSGELWNVMKMGPLPKPWRLITVARSPSTCQTHR